MAPNPSLKPPKPIFAGAAKKAGRSTPGIPQPPREKAPGEYEPLGQRDFFLMVGVLMLVMGTVNFVVSSQIGAAKAAGGFGRLWGLHAFAVVANAVGFWFACRVFLRRFQDVIGDRFMPLFARGLFRFSLLSPLLGVQVLGLALFMPKAPKGGERGLGPVFVAFLISFVLVHAGYLAWRVHSGRAVYLEQDARFQAKLKGVSPDDERLRGLIREKGALGPHLKIADALEVHLLPYLNPSLRVGVAAGRDFLRVAALDDLLSGPDAGLVCPRWTEYLGSKIDNCFFAAYERIGAYEPFLSPAPALFFESRRRGAEPPEGPAAQPGLLVGPAGAAQPGSDLEGQVRRMGTAMAAGIAALENMVLLLEPNHHRLTVREAAEPTALLLFFGNVEIPLLELARDIQQLSVAKMIVRSVELRIERLRERFEQARSVLPEAVHASYVEKIGQIDGRLKRLRERPFALSASGGPG